MPICKCTSGFVIQTFEDDGTPISQEFVANDYDSLNYKQTPQEFDRPQSQVEWEDEMGDLLEKQDYPYYFPYEMVQPELK